MFDVRSAAGMLAELDIVARFRNISAISNHFSVRFQQAGRSVKALKRIRCGWLMCLIGAVTAVTAGARNQAAQILPDPGTLQAFRGRNNEVLRFQVTGSTAGSIWGTDVYSEDSMLAVAAVHAGVLRPGQQGVVKVKILPGRQRYEPSTRHGVTSNAWGPWVGSFSFVTEP